jgi:hypothetical protein
LLVRVQFIQLTFWLLLAGLEAVEIVTDLVAVLVAIEHLPVRLAEALLLNQLYL